ncbi:MAG: hypothetical protein WB791_07855 [Waddliaceae bacterium]
MSNHEVNGFMVVRKPEYDASFIFEKGWLADPAVHNGKKYYGIERAGWEDIIVAYHYTSELDNKLKKIYEKIKNSTKGTLIGMMLSRNLEEARKILEFSNQKNGGLCELLAFESAIVTSLQGSFETEAKIHWIGYDVFKLDGWSLIRHGVFRCNEFFQKWKDKLNDFGLLPKRDAMFDELIEDYRFFEKEDLIEDLVNHENIDSVRIGIVEV